jgi:pyruvate dehydrogenase E2 component (dihydrolipoamide acetyltransferase)
VEVGTVTPDGKTISRIEKIVGVRKMIAQHMEESLRRSPQVSGFSRMDMTGVVNLKKKLDEMGLKVSITEIFIKVVALAIEKNPYMNCSRQGQEIHYYSSINMGVAVADPKGMLMVPVIKNCEKKSLLEISREMKEILALLKEGKLTPDRMTGGTFTISSLGMFNTDNSDPILNIPQAGIICLGRIRKELIVNDDDTTSIIPEAFVSVTVDHAVINGAPASIFFRDLGEMTRTADQLITIDEL